VTIAPNDPNDLNNRTPLDDGLPCVRQWLTKLQGNILKGHGRDHAAHIFVAFRDDVPVAAIARQLQDLAARYVTSAGKQLAEADDYRRLRAPGNLFGNLFLTARGYRRLGYNADAMFDEPAEPESSVTSTFTGGMRQGAADLADPPVDEWEPGYREELHGMLLLAHDDHDVLTQETCRALNALAPTMWVRIVEIGRTLRNAKKESIEHFGYVDGRSQPLFLASDFRCDASGRPLTERDGSAIHCWNPFEPLRRVLVRDPAMADDPDCHGSFLVFRKLEQDVRRFRQMAEDLADRLHFTGGDRARAAAMAIGRFENGAPVTLSATDDWQPAHENNFVFKADPHGLKCPLHSHIRKVNPRGQAIRRGDDDESQRQRRIARRGITYGNGVACASAAQDIEALPSKDVGLLFMCFQASIRRQFAFIQKEWANTVSFPQSDARVGLDPIIGQAAAPTPDKSYQGWSTLYGGDRDLRMPFERFVTMKGGEYFFAPSLPFLLSLARPRTT
jgi:Dyp-type peroxidase family